MSQHHEASGDEPGTWDVGALGPNPSQEQAPATAPVPVGSEPRPDPAATLPMPRTSDAAERALPEGQGRRPAAFQQLSELHGDPWPRRAVRALTSLVRSDDLPGRLAGTASAIQSPITTGRRVSVISAAGGAGSTTMAVLLARTLAVLRSDRVALSLGHPDRGALAARLGEQHEDNLDPVTLIGRDPVAAVEDLSRDHAFTVVDTGDDLTWPAHALAHLAVVVVPVSVAGVIAARSAMAELETSGLSKDSILLVSVETGARTGMSQQTVDALLRNDRVETLTMPRDRHLATGAVADPTLVREPTTLALHELAAAVVRRAADAR